MITQVKALIDLVDKTEAGIRDSQTRELFLPIQRQVLEVEKALFRMEQEHAQETVKLKTEIESLRSRPQPMPAGDGTLIDPSTGRNCCPRCWLSEKLMPMHDDGHGWVCEACNKVIDDPKRPRKWMSAPSVSNPQIRRPSRYYPT